MFPQIVHFVESFESARAQCEAFGGDLLLLENVQQVGEVAAVIATDVVVAAAAAAIAAAVDVVVDCCCC